MKKLADFNNFDASKADSQLRQKFENMMSEEQFVSYVKRLDSNKSYLYVNEIEHSLSEINNCSKCTSYKTCSNLVKGHYYNLTNENGAIVEQYVMCDKAKNFMYLNNITIFGKENHDWSTQTEFYNDTSRKPVIDYINAILLENDLSKKGVYLSGSFGTGKSYIMTVLIKNLAKLGYKCGYAYFPELLVTLKQEFNSSDQTILNKIKKLDVLVIDDIGSEKISEWSRDEVLGTILQYRMDNNKFTCFTSNYTIEELLTHYSKDKEVVKANRIIDRIKFLTTPFKLVSKNYRNN